MRALSLVLLLSGCSSSASSNKPDAATDAPDGLTCSTTIAEYCGANSCDQDIAAAKQDKALCPATLNMCGTFEVITKGGIDTATHYYYQGGQLVAIANLLLPGHHTCAAGPNTFVEPTCGSGSQPLPACM